MSYGRPCEHCPIGPGCFALKPHHSPLCQLQRTRKDYRDKLYELSGMEPPREPKIEPVRPPAHRRSDRVVVVARRHEDIRWVDASPYKVVVYNKGDEIDHLDGGIQQVMVANKGREAGTILRYVVENYHNLPEWVYFVQGSPHSEDELMGRLTTEYADTTGLTKHYLPTFPPVWVTDHDTSERHGGYEVRYGDARFHGGRTYEENRTWLDAVWSAWFTGPQPEPGDWRYIYAAEMAVPRHRIIGRPLSFWQSALSRVENDLNDPKKWDGSPDTAWALEAIWMFLFGDPDRYPVVMPPDLTIQATKMPGIWKMAQNFGTAVVRHAQDGFKQASPEVQKARMDTCRACPEFKSDTEQCRRCGCLCTLKKAWLSETCPLGKWEE